MNTIQFVIVVVCVVHFGVKSDQIYPLRSKRNVAQNNINGRIEKGYYVEFLIGTPPQALNILLDTGSSNFAVASKENPLITKNFHAEDSSTRKDMGVSDVDVEYTEGFWKGHLISDVVTVPSANMTKSARVDIAEITDSRRFFINESGWQGILGMAYTELTRPDDKKVKSFMQSIVEQTGMDDIFSIKLCMADVWNYKDSVSGSLTLGGYNKSLGPIYWTSIVREWYYDVQVLGMKVGNETIQIECSEFNNDKSIVDSGTTNLRFPKKIFQSVVDSMQRFLATKQFDAKGFQDFSTGNDLLCWDTSVDPYAFFPHFTLYIPSVQYNHTIMLMVHPEHYILFSGKSEDGKACYKFGVSPSDTGTVLGAVLMEEYNVVFDRANKRIGFATSDCSNTSFIHYMSGYPNSTTCAYNSSYTPTPIQIAMYALLGLLALCLLPVCILTVAWCCKKKDRSAGDAYNLLGNPMSE